MGMAVVRSRNIIVQTLVRRRHIDPIRENMAKNSDISPIFVSEVKKKKKQTNKQTNKTANKLCRD